MQIGGAIKLATRKNSTPISRETPPATTLKAREDQLIALATDLAERQMRDGTASSQLITHYLKLGSTREQKEQRKLDTETDLLVSKKEMIDSQKRVEELYGKALDAMRSYSGGPTLDDEEDDEY